LHLNPTLTQIPRPTPPSHPRQLWQLFPFLEKFYAPFEKNFNPIPIFEFISSNWWIPYTSLALYISMIIFLPRIMKNRPVKNLSKPLAYWNLFLAVYSTMGAIRVVPHLLWFVSTHTFKETVCTAPYRINGDGATGLWVTLFTLSKVAELVDTLWICLKGKKPIFLHWYVLGIEGGEGGREGGREEHEEKKARKKVRRAHNNFRPFPYKNNRYHHVSVLYFTWAAHEAAHPGMYFIAMNYTVHSVMYSYYYLMAIKAKPKWLK
jgi:hypothetical protein